MSVDCLYVFIHKHVISDPYLWLNNFSVRTGHDIESLFQDYNPVRRRGINLKEADIKERIAHEFKAQGYFELHCDSSRGLSAELVVHNNITVVYADADIMFSNRWETFLKYLQGTDDYYLVQAIEQSISALKAWGSLLDASAMLICSECIYDDLLQGITVPFNVKNIPKPFIPISPEDLQLRPQYVQALVQTTSNIDQLIFCFPITSQDTAPLQ